MNLAAALRAPSNVALAAWVAGAAAALSCGAIAFLVGGAAGLLYLCVYVLATLPGWPVGFTLFGRRHAAGWLSGALLGYAVTSLAFWAAIRMGYHSAGELTTIWAVLALAAWVPFAIAAPEPIVSPARWTHRDTLAICLIFLLVAILCGQPFRKVGVADPDGTRAYRAYFTMDFFWHTAVVAEVSKFTTPPRNPFWASEPLHYYWTYFIVPSAVIGNAPARLALEIEPVLLVNALMTAMLLAGMVFVLAWMVVPRPGVAGAATALVILSASAEGTYALLDLLHRGRPLAWVRDLNIDAMTAWAFGGLRVDDLPRSFWWVPQHATACALGLVALAGAAAHGAKGTLRAIVIEGAALGGAVVMSPFLGAALSGVYGVSIAADALAEPRTWLRRVVIHGAAAVPVAAALGWCVATGVLEGTSGAMQFGLGGLAAHAPVLGLLLSLGPVLLPAVGGLWPPRGVPRRAIPALAGLAVGLAIFYFVRVPLDEAYVGFRAGQVMLISLPGLVSLAMARWWDHPRLRTAGIGLFAALFLVGLPTTAIDCYNAQDTTNRTMGPGFLWTQTLTPDEQEAYRWIRRATEPRATVQFEPVSRGRDTWSMIPTFAHRRMAAGMAYSLLSVPQFVERSARAQLMYETLDAGQAWLIARDMGVDYIYVDRRERDAVPPAGLDKFGAHPEEFPLVFSNAEVRIYAVAGHAPQAQREPTRDILLADVHGSGISGLSPSFSR
jgi:hypothetical protein